MDSVSSTLSSESSVSFSESDTDASSIQSLALFQLAHSLPDDIATAAAEGDLTVVRSWLEADPWYDEDERESETDVNAMDEDGWTLLLHACTGPKRWGEHDDEAYVDLVRYLITQGANTLDFSAASAFYGSRKGYVFKTGDQGLGYYLDDVENAKERVLEGLEVLGRVAGLPNELRSKVLGYWCLAE